MAPVTRILSGFRLLSRPGGTALRTVLAFLAALAALSACDGGQGTAPDRNEGSLIVDSLLVLDRYSYSGAACNEVAPAGTEDIQALQDGAAAHMLVISTACYAVAVRVEDTLGTEVDAFSRRFRIHGRQDGDKDRGVEGWIAWDGRDGEGAPLPSAPYLWRMEFDFGGGRILRYRADIVLFR